MTFEIVDAPYSAGHRMGSHAHAFASVSLVLAGSFDERCGRRARTIGPLDVSVMGAGIEHDDRFGNRGAHLLSIKFAPDLVEDGVRSGAFEWRWFTGGPAVRSLMRLLQAKRHAAPVNAMEMLANDAVALASAHACTMVTTRAPAWLLRVRDAIDDAEGWPLVSDLAAIGGVHRVHLARAFQRYFSCTVSTYIRRRSIQRALALMETWQGNVSRGAHGARFADHAHMCHAFALEIGLSPSQYWRCVARTQGA